MKICPPSTSALVSALLLLIPAIALPQSPQHAINSSSGNTTKWTPCNAGISQFSNNAIVVKGELLFAALNEVPYFSSDNGTTWEIINNGLEGHDVWDLAVSGEDIFASTNDGVFRSTNNGATWKTVNFGLLDSSNITVLAAAYPNLFAGSAYGGVYLSTNDGNSWSHVDSSLAITIIRALVVKGAYLFAGTLDAGVFRSSDNGSNWQQINSGLAHDWIMAFAVSGSNIFAGTLTNGVYISTDNGSHWSAADSGLGESAGGLSFAVSDTNLFVSTGPVYGHDIGGVFHSTDNGTTWAGANSGFPFNLTVWTLAVNSTYIFAQTGSGVWRRALSDIDNVGSAPSHLPTNFTLRQNFPNPFNPTTTISFSIPARSATSLKVFDVLGREVTTLVSGELEAGSYTQQWNAINIPSGVYLYRLRSGALSAAKKLLLLK